MILAFSGNWFLCERVVSWSYNVFVRHSHDTWAQAIIANFSSLLQSNIYWFQQKKVTRFANRRHKQRLPNRPQVLFKHIHIYALYFKQSAWAYINVEHFEMSHVVLVGVFGLSIIGVISYQPLFVTSKKNN